MVCYWMIVLSENCTYSIVGGINLNLEQLLQIGQGEYWS